MKNSGGRRRTQMPELDRKTGDSPELSAVEFHRIITLSKAAELSSLSEDTIKRRYPEKLIKLSPRRIGMRIGDALMLSKESA